MCLSAQTYDLLSGFLVLPFRIRNAAANHRIHWARKVTSRGTYRGPRGVRSFFPTWDVNSDSHFPGNARSGSRQLRVGFLAELEFPLRGASEKSWTGGRLLSFSDGLLTIRCRLPVYSNNPDSFPLAKLDSWNGSILIELCVA